MWSPGYEGYHLLPHLADSQLELLNVRTLILLRGHCPNCHGNKPKPGFQISSQSCSLWIWTEGEMVGWHHRLNGHEFEQTPGGSAGQGSLAWYSSWGRKELDTTGQMNSNSNPSLPAIVVTISALQTTSSLCVGSECYKYFIMPCL